MLLHDIVHTTLIFSCLVANLSPIGLVFLFCHSFSDIWVALSKTIHLLGYMDGFNLIFFLFCNLGWIYFRLICVPAIIWEYQSNIL